MESGRNPGYHLVAAQDLVMSLALPGDVCGECGACPAGCANRWDVSARVRDIVHLRDVPPGFVA